MSVLDLARTDLRKHRRYQPGSYTPDCVRLNANESPWRLPSDTTDRGLNIYPPPRPEVLRAKLAEHYAVAAEKLLVTRGSSEAIDLLIRGFCEAGRDRILICPPTFDLYRFYASVQGAGVVTAPLAAARDFALNREAILDSLGLNVKIVFVCSPNNPTGGAIPRDDMEAICAAASGRALVVIDEAYQEFAESGDFLDLSERYEHVVLLRTLSKSVALAGARCGTLIAAPEVIEFLDNILPPYTFPTPSIELVLEALNESSLVVARERANLIRRERARMSEALMAVPDVLQVYPSDANFVLVRVRDQAVFVEAARKANILVRGFAGQTKLENCVRISIGRPEDNDHLLKALAGAGEKTEAGP